MEGVCFDERAAGMLRDEAPRASRDIRQVMRAQTELTRSTRRLRANHSRASQTITGATSAASRCGAPRTELHQSSARIRSPPASKSSASRPGSFRRCFRDSVTAPF